MTCEACGTEVLDGEIVRTYRYGTLVRGLFRPTSVTRIEHGICPTFDS